ncbi:MAG: hypothetical protein G01um101420_223 [Parcubacteria group bacterium Gr01-1014_20]|nr:MAG: hypothetical protein G01um101420_223 [Parcubacteria group bacterium Gr01-1014_20]
MKPGEGQSGFETSKDVFSAENVSGQIAAAFNSPEKKAVYLAKKAFLEKYPTETQAIETVFGIIPTLRNSEGLKTMDAKKDGWKKVKQTLKNVTEYNFLLTDLIHNNIENREFLEGLWKTLSTLARDVNQEKQFDQLRRGILSQVAAWRVLEENGSNPKLSHPGEDAFDSIDLWTEKGEAVQVKGAPIHGVALIETDTVAFPGVTFEGKGGGNHYHLNSHLFLEAQRFKAKMSRYGELHNEDTKGLFLVVPYEDIDFTTGEPNRRVVDEVKKSLPV